MAPLDLQRFATQKEPDNKGDDGNAIAIEEHGARVDAVGIEWQRTQRVGAIEDGGEDAGSEAFHA